MMGAAMASSAGTPAHAAAHRRRTFRILLLAGLLLRAAALPLWGTEDMRVWQTWSYAATNGVLTMYGAGGSPPERGVVSWGEIHTTVDYPPATLYGLAVIGHAYRLVDPGYEDSRRLIAAIKLSILLMDVLACGLLWRLVRGIAGTEAGRTAALFYWLNPAAILDGAVLGYLDPWVAAPVLAALVAARAGAGAWCGAAFAVALMLKLQAVFVVPIGALMLWHLSPRRLKTSAAAVTSCVAVVALALLPFAIQGALANVVQGVGALFRQDMLSATAANLWWIITWALRVQYAIPDIGAWASWTMTTRILGMRRVMELGYPNPRPIGLALVIAASGWALHRARRAMTHGASSIVLLGAGAFVVHAYFMLAVQVHENHLYLALPLLAAAAAIDARYRAVTAAISAIVTLNLLLFYGIGRDLPPLPRTITVIDASVLLSFVHVFVFTWHARVLHRVTSPPLVTRTETAY
jgi:hypothetical protein